ncbi:MAG: Sensor protein [uncultured bacterium]|nr:MAG: Sensor protein [uncultured bacterium]
MNIVHKRADIMVVDDTPANLELLTEILHREGYGVVGFPSGDMALPVAARNPPDLILLDILMPEMDGFEVCRRLKSDEMLKEIPVIFISALDDTVNKAKAFSEGGVDYISKPFQEEEVLARIRTHLSLRRQQLDIEEQKQQIQHSYECLRELEEQRDQLVLMIVHDMRSPLTGILGYTELLETNLKKKTGCDDLVQDVKELRESGKALYHQISTILDISRMESNAMPLEMDSCDLRTVVSKALTSLGALVGDATIIYAPPAKVVTAFCDPEITRRIVENLTANAIKFAGRDGLVHIDLSHEANGVKVMVSDTGPGIPPAYHQRIFEKFGQVAARQEGKRYSTGLGLTFCKLAVEAQGGQIGVQSEVDKGSRFWFILPSAPLGA